LVDGLKIEGVEILNVFRVCLLGREARRALTAAGSVGTGPATRQDFELYAGRDYGLRILAVNNEDGSGFSRKYSASSSLKG
jgi:hypothetical protein